MCKPYTIKNDNITVNTHMGKFILNNLTKINFSKDNIDDLENNSKFKNKKDKKGVYCFTYKEIILYIGKTDKNLHTRMKQYLKGNKSQKTNYRIKNALLNKTVNLYFISEDDIKNVKDFEKNYEHWKKIQEELDNKKTTINRFAEIIITGYCFNKDFLGR